MESLYLKGGDLSAESARYNEKLTIWNIKDFFSEPFFETKKYSTPHSLIFLKKNILQVFIFQKSTTFAVSKQDLSQQIYFKR